ncbi:unnamed protein product [Lymnaea stagnalis]|uniref:Cilia- and flagella-associated protein 157 n=1 Tax=Lymnaea stagnalis TaxID=6523 RepID=A0AAV2H7H4_LYMST
MSKAKAKTGKKVGKSGGAGITNGKTTPLTFSKGSKLDDTTKQFYLWQMQLLQDKVIKYQRQNDELVVASAKFQEKMEGCIAEKHEVVEYYKILVDTKSFEYNQLHEKYLTLKQILDNEQEQCRKQMMNIRREADEHQSQIVAENITLSSKLAALEEFQLQRDALMAKLERMEAELANKNEEFNANLTAMERKLISNKERLKAEMIVRIKGVATEFRKVTDKTLNSTIKRTLSENLMVGTQLAKMSDKTVELIEENEAQFAAKAKLEQKVVLLETNEKELTKRYQKCYETLNGFRQRCLQQEEIIDQLRNNNVKATETKIELEQLREESNYLRREIKRLAEMNDNFKKQHFNKRLVSLTEMESRENLEMMFSNAVDNIRELVLSMSQRAEPGCFFDEKSLNDIIKLKNEIFQNLMIILKSSLKLGIRPVCHGQMPPDENFDEKLSQMKLDSSLIKGKRLRPHYKLGDLGLTPRPDEHISTNKEKMHRIYQLAHANSSKLLHKNVKCQTASTPLALLHAHQTAGKPKKEPPVLGRVPTGQGPLPIPKISISK